MSLGGPIGAACVPAVANACLIDAVLANNGNPAGSGKSGYLFTTGAGSVAGGVNVGYTVVGVPITINQTGIRAFCAEEDAVVRVDPAGVCSNTEAGILTFNPLNSKHLASAWNAVNRRAANASSLLLVCGARQNTCF